MKKHKPYILFAGLLLLWAAPALACNFPGFTAKPAGEQAILTAAAETTIARVTEAGLQPTGETPEATLATPTATTPILTPAASATPLPTVTPTATALPTPAGFETIFEDDFRSDIIWYESTADNFGFELVADGYRLYVNFVNGAIVSVRSQDHTAVRLEAEAAFTTSPPDGYWGVACRQQDPENYYGFVLTSAGNYGILRNLDGEITFLNEGPAPAGLFVPGGANRLAGACVEDRLTLYLAGQPVTEIQDTTFENGNIGVLAGTRSAAGVDVLFTYFAIQVPQEP